jgi:hypothetical protein
MAVKQHPGYCTVVMELHRDKSASITMLKRMAPEPSSEQPPSAGKLIPPEALRPWWSVIPMREEVIYATHNSDHTKLEESVHLTIQHLREQLLALHRKGEAIEQGHAGWDRSAFGLTKPTPQQQELLFDLHREFFDLTYSTLSALAAALNRLTKHVTGVPTSSNSKFIKWLKTQDNFGSPFERTPIPGVLMSARDFRTIYVHPAQFKPINWMTAMGDNATVVLLGTAPPWPDGVRPTSESTWDFHAPNTRHVLWALVEVCRRYFMTLITSYEEDHTRCKWEEQGFGSSHYTAAKKRVGELLERHYSHPPGAERDPRRGV